MSLSLHTNIASQFANRYMGNAQNSVRTQVERLSSGLRINTAADDAAGLSISSRMTSHIRSSMPLMRGINDGVSLLQVAGGGLRSTLDCLQRARELSIQAGNSLLQGNDREALDVEYQQMMAQVNHISNTTEAFGIFPLKGVPSLAQAQIPPTDLGTTPHITDVFPKSGASYNGASGIKPIAYIPQGATDILIKINCFSEDDDIQIFTTSGAHLVGTPLSDFTWDKNSENPIKSSLDIKNYVFKTEYGFKSNAAYDSSPLLDGSSQFTKNIDDILAPPLTGNFNGMEFNYTGDGDYDDGSINNGFVTKDPEELLSIDQTTEPLIIVITGSGRFDATVSWGTMPPKGAAPTAPSKPSQPVAGEGLHILTSATPGLPPSFVTIEKTPTDTKTLGIIGSALNPMDAVMRAIHALDAAITKVTDYAAKDGAIEARLLNASSNAGLSSEVTSAARSRIMDADFAIETAQLSAQMMRSSASTAMSAQANLTPKLVMSLLSSTEQQWQGLN